MKSILCHSLLFLFLFLFSSILFAQEKKSTVLYLKNGYSVKGEIVEQTDKSVKIKTIEGELIEYSVDDVIRSEFSKSAVKTSSFKGETIISMGIGLGPMIYNKSELKNTIPLISTAFEIGIIDLDVGSIGVGGQVSFTSNKYDYNSYYIGLYSARYNNLIFGARSSYHYPIGNSIDTYAGFMVGLNMESIKFTEDDPNGFYFESSKNNEFIWSLYAGGRYYFSDNFAAMAEVGYGIAWLTLGVSLKF